MPVAPFVRRTAVLALLALAGCAQNDLRVEFAPGVRDAHPAVSVVGIYREGRLSPESWDMLASPVCGALSGAECEPGYTDALRQADPALFDELDDGARREGVTEELLARLAPHAKGDLLMVVQYYGPTAPTPASAGRRRGHKAPPPPSTGSSLPTSRRGGLGMSNMGMAPSSADPQGDRGVNIQMAAQLYSVQRRAFVGRIELTVEGKDPAAALRTFGEHLGAELKGTRSAGWTWPAPHDASPAPAPPAAAEPAGSPSP